MTHVACDGQARRGILVFIVFTRSRSVASHVLTVLGGLLVLVVGLSVATAYAQAVRHVEDAAASRVVDVARAVAATDDVREALASPDPAAELAGVVERARALTATDFIVVMSPAGVRYTHPTPALVGGHYVGSIADAVAGAEIVEQFTGSLGPSTRAVVPVLVDGEVTGLVAVGIGRDQVSRHLAATLPQALLPGLAAALLGGAGAWWVARRVRQQTLGLNAVELRRLHDHHDAVLHAVREGLIITDRAGLIQVVNDEARRLLGLGPDAVGRPVAEVGLAPGLAALLRGQRRQVDVPHASGGRVLLLSSDVVRRQGAAVATLTTLRDRTELAELTGQLATTQSLADALHAQAHEAANRLHTVITLIEVGRAEDAVAFATQDLDAARRQRDAILTAIEEPAAAALLLGKVSQAAERGVTLELDPDAHLPAGVLPPHPVVTILGNLIDNALDALAAHPGDERPGIVVDAQSSGGQVTLTVSDNGPGLDETQRERAFDRGFTTKDAAGPAGRGIGLALVRQNAELLGGSVAVSDPPGATFTVVLPAGDHG